MRGTSAGVAAYWCKVLANSRQLVFVMDTTRRLVAVSGGLADVLGVNPEQLLGRSCASLLHGDAGAPSDCPLDELLLDGEQHVVEVHSDVLDKDLLVTATPLSYDGDHVTHVLHVATDVTEPRRREQALRESESRLVESQRLAGLGHYILDIPSGTWTSSPGFDEILGIDERYVRTVESWLDLIHPSEREAMATYLDHVLRNRLPFDREYRIRRHSDGGVRWVHGLGRLEPGTGGTVERLFGVIRNVTEERESRRSLEKTTALLEEAERLAHLGSWEWDLRSGVTRYSEEWQRIYGVAHDQNALHEWLELVHPEDRDKAAAAIEKAAREGHWYRAEHRIVRPDSGEIRHVESFGRQVRGDDGTVDRIYGATLDVTERVEAQRRLRSTLAATVTALSATVEIRDPYTAGHQQRVAELSDTISQALGWDHERREDVRVAASLHDIGKVVVPAEILTKPGRLSVPEYELVKSHAGAAGEILSGIEWSGPVMQTILQHHERLDGSGYPLGLKGDAIIPEARVVAVADVFEAMVSHRPYRPALTPNVAIAELRDGAGRCYDGEVVDACLGVIAGGFRFSQD